MTQGQDVNIAAALWQLSNSQNDIDLVSNRTEREYLKKELLQSHKEVAALKKELNATRTQLREKKECNAALARRLQEHTAEIEFLRSCEEEWIQDLERQAMRPVIGVEVQEVSNADGSSSLVVTSMAQKGVAAKGGVQLGDVITRFGKTEIVSKRSFAEALLAAPLGSKQPVQVLRHGTTPTGKPCTSVETLQVQIAGAAPTGFSADLLREAADPETLVLLCRKEGVNALAAIGDAACRARC